MLKTGSPVIKQVSVSCIATVDQSKPEILVKIRFCPSKLLNIISKTKLTDCLASIHYQKLFFFSK